MQFGKAAAAGLLFASAVSAKHAAEAKVATIEVGLSDGMTSAIIVVCAALGYAFAMYWWYRQAEISIDPTEGKYRANSYLTGEVMRNVAIISKRVSDGATSFLVAEYKAMAIFMTGFGAMLYALLGFSQQGNKEIVSPFGNAFVSLVAFLGGALTSVVSGWIGMRIAVYSNSRTAIRATEGADEGDQGAGFAAAFEIGRAHV